MKSFLELEVGENRSESTCQCCGNESATGHGFIYKHGDPYAVYYAAWSQKHDERRVSIAVAVGRWENESSFKDRVCFGVLAIDDQVESKVKFRFIDPAESPWPNTELLGPMLERISSLQHPKSKEIIEICTEIIYRHPAVSDYLGIKN